MRGDLRRSAQDREPGVPSLPPSLPPSLLFLCPVSSIFGATTMPRPSTLSTPPSLFPSLPPSLPPRPQLLLNACLEMERPPRHACFFDFSAEGIDTAHENDMRVSPSVPPSLPPSLPQCVALDGLYYQELEINQCDTLSLQLPPSLPTSLPPSVPPSLPPLVRGSRRALLPRARNQPMRRQAQPPNRLDPPSLPTAPGEVRVLLSFLPPPCPPSLLSSF